MNWTVDKKKQVAQSERGYRISWCKNKHGTWFNGYAPDGQRRGRHLEASYKLETVKAACDAHWAKQLEIAA